MDDVDHAAVRIGMLMRGIQNEQDLDAIRGREGDVSRLYFSVFDRLITAQKGDFFFTARSRRPPMDNINALLSFIYTLVAHDCTGALEAVGLDPQVGFLHRDRSGRPSLALDLMEEFRPFFADRLALSLVNLRQVQPNGFRKTESGAVEMTEETRKVLLVAYQKRKQEEMVHPFLGESAQIGLFFHVQALLLARHVRGELDGYPPVIWK
jgi:CRISPR-associated protein Cas1